MTNFWANLYALAFVTNLTTNCDHRNKYVKNGVYI